MNFKKPIYEKKATIDGKMLNVVNYESYSNNLELYADNRTGIELEKDDDKFVLPYKGSYNTTSIVEPGIYNAGAVDFAVYPCKNDTKKYQPKIKDFNDVSSVKEYIETQSSVRNIERDILTTPDNIFQPQINEADEPEMKLVKEAINAKGIDIDKYAERFGDNFPNDKRQFKNKSMTLYMIKRMANCLDMDIEMIIRDKNPDVPNPIGKEISGILTTPDITFDE